MYSIRIKQLYVKCTDYPICRSHTTYASLSQLSSSHLLLNSCLRKRQCCDKNNKPLGSPGAQSVKVILFQEDRYTHEPSLNTSVAPIRTSTILTMYDIYTCKCFSLNNLAYFRNSHYSCKTSGSWVKRSKQCMNGLGYNFFYVQKTNRRTIYTLSNRDENSYILT